MPRDIRRLVASVAGEFTIAADHSWGGSGRPAVWEVKGLDGRRWFAKRHTGPKEHRREVTAYRRWTSALGEGRAPVLAAADTPAQAIVVTAVPGRSLGCRPPAPEREREAYRQAGHLLALLHSAPVGQPEPGRDALGSGTEAGAERGTHCGTEPGTDSGPDIGPGIGTSWEADVEATLNGAALYLTAEDDALVRAITEEPPPARPQVVAHADFQPRNWLWDEEQQLLRVIGFERTCVEPAVRRDLCRLEYGFLHARSGLRSAFYEGYGRELTADERRACAAYAAVAAVSALRWGIEHRDLETVEQAHAMLGRLRAERAECCRRGGSP
ncbi:aminoglycoside phosphotransferase family protein [Streptomyces sp. 7N604]|uniref:aminoglycoside phosphotransferase family protein n=1 Tax=Streptomyces sp. 7N604 TaxID=3457415 RepID=UPI003FD51637